MATILDIDQGGTGANLTATGNYHHVVLQEGVGAPFSVRQLSAYDDIKGLSVPEGMTLMINDQGYWLGAGMVSPSILLDTDQLKINPARMPSGAGYVLTDVLGNGVLSMKPSAGGGADTNFANVDLMFTGDRQHTALGFDFSVVQMKNLYLRAADGNIDIVQGNGIDISSRYISINGERTDINALQLYFGSLPNNQAADRILSTDVFGQITYMDLDSIKGGSGWGLTGNTGTNPATNFIGTTDNQPLSLRSNNIIALTILPNGNTLLGQNILVDKANDRMYVPFAGGGTLTNTGQGYYIGSPSARYSALQGVYTGSSTFTFLTCNKYFSGSAWLDMGFGRVGSSFQLQDNQLTFYSFDTGTNPTVLFHINANGNTLIGTQNDAPASQLDVRSPTGANCIRLGYRDNSGIYTYTLGRNAGASAYLDFQGFQPGSVGYAFIGGAVIIGAAINTPAAASAILEVQGTTKGVLFPRMTTSQKLAIGSPANGLIVFDTDINKLCVYEISTWVAYGSGSGGGAGGWTITAGKTPAITNSLTLIGTDGTSHTFPTTNSVLARTDAAQTFTGTQTFTGVIYNGLAIYPTTGIANTIVHRPDLAVGISFPSTGTTVITSGTRTTVNIGEVFAPTSGNAAMSVLTIGASINQTGGANGVTRAIYISPAVTAAADFRAIDIATAIGYGIYQGGANVTNYFGGQTVINGQLANTRNPTASNSALVLTGTWFTGGDTTSTKPYTLIEPTGTVSNAWSIGGTGLGINAAAGFAGNLLDLQVGGAQKFYLSGSGNLYVSQITLCTIIRPVSAVTLYLGYLATTNHPVVNTFLIDMAAGTMTQASGTNGGVRISPTYNQLGSTAANTDLLINRTETAIGSGAQRLIDAQVNSVSKFYVDKLGQISNVSGAYLHPNGQVLFYTSGPSINAAFRILSNSPNTLTSGNATFSSIEPQYNQTGSTVNNTDFQVNRLETAIGSGVQRLLSLKVAGVEKFGVDNVGNVTTTGSIKANSVTTGFATTATAGGTTTLTAASPTQQYFTGTLTQTVILPVASTLTQGQPFIIVNNSSAPITVQSSGGIIVQVLTARSQCTFTLINTAGTDASSWSAFYALSGSSRIVLVNNAAVTNNSGGITEVDIYSGTIPANSIGINGSLHLDALWSMTNNANPKSVRIRFNNTTIMTLPLPASNASVSSYAIVRNRGTLTDQISGPNNAGGNTSFNVGSTSLVSPTNFNTGQDIAVRVTSTNTVGTDVTVMEAFEVRAYY